MKEMLQKLREASVAAILQADDITALENLRVKYLGKKGELTAILKQIVHMTVLVDDLHSRFSFDNAVLNKNKKRFTP